MLPFLVLCALCCTVLGQIVTVPSFPDDFSATFIATLGKTSEVLVGGFYFSKELNKGATIVKRGQHIEHLVFNYNTSQVLVSDERGLVNKRCDFVEMFDLQDDLNPLDLIKHLTNEKLKFIHNDTSLGGIPGNWFKTPSDNGSTIAVTYNATNWNFPSDYTFNTSRPISLTTISPGKVESFYFVDATNYIPQYALVPPAEVFCPSFSDTYADVTPTLPVGFSIDVEMYKEDVKTGSEIYYNSNAKVFREDLIVDNLNKVTFVTDKNYGVIYEIHEGSCKTLKLLEVDKDNSKNEILFGSDSLKDFRYIGDGPCWQGKCSIWSGTSGGIFHHIFFKTTRQKVYGEVKDVYVPVKSINNWNAMSQDPSSTYFQHYFNFEPTYPEWERFDVSSCYGTNQMRIQISFSGSYYGIKSIPQFLGRIRFAIRQRTQVPEMRMHKFRIDNVMNEIAIVTFTLLEDPRLARLNSSVSTNSFRIIRNYQVYNSISNLISRGAFIVKTSGADGKEIDFKAYSITNKLLSQDIVDKKGAALARYHPRYHMKIDKRSTDFELKQLKTVDGCAQQCDFEQHATCNMFMFCADTQTCVLSESLIEDRSDHHYSSNCDVFTRNFAFDYQPYQFVRLKHDPETDVLVTDKSMASCFADCFKMKDGACHSIDFCADKDGKHTSCNYHAKHVMQQAIRLRDTSCIHYSLKFLSMYKVSPNTSIKDAATRYTSIKYETSITACAQNCFLDPSGCNDFEICKFIPTAIDKTVCYILEPKNSTGYEEKPKFVDNTGCDHYRLKGAKTVFNIEYVPTQKPINPEKITTSDTIAAEPNVSPNNDGGYGSGSMAALGIIMLLLAGAGGAGAVYFYIRRQQLRGNDDSLVMRFVQSNQ